MREIEILAEGLAEDNRRLTNYTRRFPYYADELARLLLGKDTTEATDEELELSYHEISSSLFEKTDSPNAFSEAILRAERAYLASETVKALTERATIRSFLPTLTDQEGKCVYFRNAYSDEAFRIFAPFLSNPTVSYADSPSAACREVEGELASFAILPVFSSKEGVISGIAREVSRYELALALTCDVTLPSANETMTMGLFAQTPIAVEGAEEMEIVLFCDDSATLTSLILSTAHLFCPVRSVEALTETEGFGYAYRIGITCRKNESLLPVWLLLRCEYPHHRLCGIWRKIVK